MRSVSLRLCRCLGILILLAGAGPSLRAKDRPTPQPDPIMESDQPDAASKALKLPLLKEGPGKDYYVYHRGRNFEAMVNGGGGLEVYLLDDDGQRLSKAPWTMHGGISTSWSKLIGYNPKNDRPIVKHFARYMKEIKEASEPTAEPRKPIEVKALLMDDVVFIRRYEFGKDFVKVSSGYDCPNKSHGSRYRIGISFAACMKFPPSVEQPEREAQLKGYEIELIGPSKKKKKDTQTIPYSKSENFAIASVEQLTAVGPWGKRVVKIKADAPILHPSKYSGRCPYEGFELHYDLPNGTDKLSKQVDIRYEFE